jgi:hypothetical protein
MIDEILDHALMLDRQILELHPAPPGADLRPGIFRDFLVVYDLAFDPVHVDKTVIAAEYLYFGVLFLISVYTQIPDAQPSQADILDLPHIYELIGSYESSERPLFAFEPLEFPFFLKHLFPLFRL